MSVPEQIPYVGYIANGQTTNFPITFDLHDPEYLIVTVNKEIPVTGTYSVDLGSKNVVFAAAPVDGTQIELYRETELNRDTNYQSYDNSFRPSAVNYDFDKIWHVLQEQEMIDAELLARLKSEIEWRRTHDANFDELSKMRDAQVFAGLKQYTDTLYAASNPNIFEGITAGIVFALDKKSVQTHLENIYQQLASGSNSIAAEQQRAIAAEQSLQQNITNEATRAIGAEAVLNNKINANGVGNRAYKTWMEMDADKANIPAKSKVTVTNDPNPNVNGDYQWDGVTFTKSAYDPFTQARDYSKNTVSSVAAKAENIGYYTGASTANVISTTATAFGFEVLKSGKITGFKTQLAGSPATVSLQIYRAKEQNVELISTQDINLTQALSVVELSVPLPVKKGDIVALKYLSGAFVRGLVVATGEPLGSYTITTPGATVGDVAVLGRNRNKPEFEFSFVSSDVDKEPQTPQLISPIASNVGPLKSETVTTNGEFFTDTTTTGSLTYAYGTSKSLSVYSKLKQIKYKARVTSINAKFTIAVIEKSSDSFFVRDLIPVSAPADVNGIVIATKDHFGDIFVPKDGHVMVLGATTSDAVLAKTGTTLGWYYVAASSLVKGGNVSVLFSTSNPISLEISFSSVESNLSDRITKLENNLVMPTPLLYSKALIKEKFLGTSLPTDWTETGGWTVNNGLKSPTAGGWTVFASQNQSSSLAKRVYRGKFLVADASSVFGICTTPIETSSGSAVAMVDGTQNKLIIYSWDGTSAGTSVASVAIPALVANRSYYLEVEKNGYFSTVTLTDTITQVKTKVEYSATAPYVQFHGQAGVIFINGDITVQYFSFNALYPNEPHSIIVGDSNSERAANVLPNQTWAFKYAEMRHLNADVIVAGRSGDETPNFLKRKQFDLLVWKPKYVIWALGTNDTSQATWRTNMTQNIADTVALGAEPILVTQIPRTDSQALRTAMNDDIRNGYFGNYRYVDFAKAVSLNNDGVTWDPLYNSGDGVHVNPAGQQKLLQQLLSDAPDVLY